MGAECVEEVVSSPCVDEHCAWNTGLSLSVSLSKFLVQ